jgi:ribose transport system substrate-binding protein
MNQLGVLVSLATDASDFQREQAKAAEETAARLGMTAQIIYAQDDALTQSEQLLKVIQGDAGARPQAIVIQPCGQTALPHVARAAAAAGIGWVVLNWAVDYVTELRQTYQTPAFIVSSDQQEIGRIQGRQIAALLPDGGSILYIQGPTHSPASRQRSQGFLETKPGNVQVRVLKGEGWTERDGKRAAASWLRLSTSQQARPDAVVAQNDLLALGARNALLEQNHRAAQDSPLEIPFTGVDGLTRGGQAWVQAKTLAATVVVATNCGVALELLAKAMRTGTQPPEITFTTPYSYPPIEELTKAAKAK